ncbi:uncharacterized protein LOC114392018 isoform X2 [Glycine soja]|uniref:uncharacterized protein LOC114392018 isoform X2 n=1 Tax=Glycine soja TaxID=3848 RepID=UPI00103A6294|nr:uncharacterized protein LOC114392018 isoform X2 [Glycine soja]
MAVKGSLRFVYAHFPIKASIGNNNKSIKIRNFLGEKKVQWRGRHLLCRNNWELDCISDNVANGSFSLFPIVAAIIADSFFGSFLVALVSYCVSFLVPDHILKKGKLHLYGVTDMQVLICVLGRLLFVLLA